MSSNIDHEWLQLWDTRPNEETTKSIFDWLEDNLSCHTYYNHPEVGDLVSWELDMMHENLRQFIERERNNSYENSDELVDDFTNEMADRIELAAEIAKQMTNKISTFLQDWFNVDSGDFDIDEEQLRNQLLRQFAPYDMAFLKMNAKIIVNHNTRQYLKNEDILTIWEVLDEEQENEFIKLTF